MAVNTQRNDIIMNPNATYSDVKSAQQTIRGAVGLSSLSPEPQKVGPISEALSALYNSIGTAHKNQEILENQFSPVLASYPVIPFNVPGQEEKRETSGCRLSDEIYELVRMMNSLVDRQEAMSRHIQL